MCLDQIHSIILYTFFLPFVFSIHISFYIGTIAMAIYYLSLSDGPKYWTLTVCIRSPVLILHIL